MAVRMHQHAVLDRILAPMGSPHDMVVVHHLPGSEHRIKELRTMGAAALPGHTLVVLDPQLMLVIDAFPCEDGHAQERSLLGQVAATVQPKDLWIDDRNFCTTGFLFLIARREGFFLVRQHAATLTYTLV